jgi:hypothetical protein
VTTRADRRGWDNPFTPGFEDRMVVVEAGGVRVRVHRDVADVFRYVNTVLAHTYRLGGFADDWGFNCRPIRGREDEWAATHDLKYLSNHSWGLAEDLDSSINPMTRDLKARHEFVRAVVDPILKPFGGRVVWGGEYVSPRKDYMHFEYVGTHDQARADAATARRLLAALTNPPTPEGDELTADDLKKIDALIKKRVDAAVKALHDEHALIIHGNEYHPNSLDSIAAKLEAS